MNTNPGHASRKKTAIRLLIISPFFLTFRQQCPPRACPVNIAQQHRGALHGRDSGSGPSFATCCPSSGVPKDTISRILNGEPHIAEFSNGRLTMTPQSAEQVKEKTASELLFQPTENNVSLLLTCKHIRVCWMQPGTILSFSKGFVACACIVLHFYIYFTFILPETGGFFVQESPVYRTLVLYASKSQ